MKQTTSYTPVPGDLPYLQDTLYAIGGKWKLPILYSLAQGNKKFSDLQKNLSPITAKVLARELRELELNGFIIRKPSHEFTSVHQYEVTEYCQSFETIITAMIRWGKTHRAHITHRK